MASEYELCYNSYIAERKGRENGYIFSTGTFINHIIDKRRDNFIRYMADITMLYFCHICVREALI